MQNNQKYCFIINPSKANFEEIKQQIVDYCVENNVNNYSFSLTTVEDAGNLQAREAIDDGCDVIVVVGGDGTVRSVICGVIKSENPKSKDIEIAIIPNGTGNILAFNLKIPLNNFELAMHNAINLKSNKIDVGFCRNDENTDFQHIFLTIAGVGYDANMIKQTKDAQKEKLGSLAYYSAGVKQVFKPKINADIDVLLPNGDNMKTKAKLRTLMVANCGNIPGFTLVPNAKVNDGLLDIIAIDTKAGLLGWMQLGTEIVLQKFGVKNDSKYKLGRIEHTQGKQVTLRLTKPAYAQLDGDLLEKTDYLQFTIFQNAVNLRYFSE